MPWLERDLGEFFLPVNYEARFSFHDDVNQLTV